MIKALRGPEFASAWFGFSGPWRDTYITGREASLRVPFIVRWPGTVPASNDIHGVKWRHWKMMSKEMDSGNGPVTELSVPRFYNLLIDPKEEHPAMPSTPEHFWIRFPAGQILTDHAATLTPDPSQSPQAQP
jgi:hypothetical protein